MNNNIEFKCLECQKTIENDDNFCYSCGHWTARGFKFLNNPENFSSISNGIINKQNNKLKLLISLLSISIIIFAFIIIIRGTSIIRPLAFLKKQTFSIKNGYNSTILKTDNIYNNIEVSSYEDAKIYIKEDVEKQDYLCKNNFEVRRIEYDLETTYNIASINFCDMSLNESQKIRDVIDKMYKLFPSIEGALTNITITNAKTKDEYIAYFQPMFQFINPNENISIYNKVNKTQILLNSYYFLNDFMLSKPIDDIVGENWYVKDATWESTIAHELGHYISFKILLKENNLDNITFVTNNNISIINNVLNEFDSQKFSLNIINKALENYNLKYKTNLNINEFASTISNYASTLDKNGQLIADETIAEAIHDYYLHNENCTKASLEIVNIIKSKLRLI